MIDIREECITRHRKVEFSVKEEKSEVIFHNPELYEIHQIHVDGCVFREGDGRRCDWLININGKKQSILVELKGSDIDEAIRQIQRSAEHLDVWIKDRAVWIVSYSGSPRFSTTIQNLIFTSRRDYRARLLIKESSYYHTL